MTGISTRVAMVILGLFGTMIVTGILLVIRYTATTADKFRTLQTASGGYFAAFIASHTLAVFVARANNVDTNWEFAAGGSPRTSSPAVARRPD